MLQDLDQKAERWTPVTREDKAIIQVQLERLLLDPRFSHSKRYPSFLRFVVAHALGKAPEGLKERAVGTEVFGRSPDYDTNNDPIVRVTAVEIRKRLSVYYEDPAHKDEVRLQLPPGSYVPSFYLPVHATLKDTKTEGEKMPEVPGELLSENPSQAENHPSRFRELCFQAVLAAIVILFVVAGLVLWQKTHESALSAFWSPIFRSSAPVFICVADQNQDSSITLKDTTNPEHQMVRNDHLVSIAIDDTVPLLAVGEILQSHHQTYRVKGQASTTFADLRQGPDVLIGAFDNSWALRLTQPLRFHFANNPQLSRLWIEDRQNPNGTKWVRDLTQLTADKPYTDYAIVARYFDPVTNNFVIVAAGLGDSGTAAAGEFLLNPQYPDELARRAPPHWERENLEVVLQTSVIGNSSGSPQIVAMAFW